MIDLPADLVVGLRQRLGIGEAAEDVSIPVEAMAYALGDRISLADLVLVIRAGDWTDEVILTSDGRLDLLQTENRLAA